MGREREAIVVMDHQEAVRLGAVEKYLLKELSPPERDEFEEHFFDCQECAADLKAAAAFLDGARREFKRGPLTKSMPDDAKTPWFSLIWKPAFAAPAFALLLFVIAYQNLVMYPRLAGADTRLETPEILASVSLIGANSRGGAPPSITVAKAQSILLSVDIPAGTQYSGYALSLVAPSGAVVWQLPVSAEQAKDTVAIRLPAAARAAGDYHLIVQGLSQLPREEPAELARYRFTLNSSN